MLRLLVLAMAVAQAAAFLAPASMLPLRASRSANCDRSALTMQDEMNSKKVAGYEQSLGELGRPGLGGGSGILHGGVCATWSGLAAGVQGWAKFFWGTVTEARFPEELLGREQLCLGLPVWDCLGLTVWDYLSGTTCLGLTVWD